MKHKPFDAERIKGAVQQFFPAGSSGEINIFKSINSTNAWLLENGQYGDICLSESQTNGRGRRGNAWISPDSGNIYFSYCYGLNDAVEQRSLLSLVTGVAIAEALTDIGLSGHGLKWPNDIYWQRKKMGGVLIESSNQSDRLIIGIGLNLNLPDIYHSEITQAAVSLNDVLKGSSINRDEMVIHLIRRLIQRLNTFENSTFDEIKQGWKEWDILLGETVSFQHQGDLVSGEVKELDQHGRLGISNETGGIEYYSSAEIKLRKL